MERKIRCIITEQEAGMLVKDILRRRFSLSARQISRMKFRPDGILVNGAHVTVRHVLAAGEVLELSLESAEKGSDHLIPVKGTLDIRYEDQDMVVINKPAGLVVHPSHGHYTDSLANILVGYYGSQGKHLVVRPVGRLDKDTSGLIIVAKHAAAAASFDRQRQEGTLQRIYLALVEGRPDSVRGTVNVPIGRNDNSIILRQVRPDGDRAVTDYELLKKGSEYSLVRLRLHTGRTHQIRVHMAWLGHPLLGDSLYGTEGSGGLSRAALHSAQISCRQPFTGEPLCFQAGSPEDMEALIQRL